ncbi:hypothetical protein FRC09_015359 [Ceratobasidium sp. 395]|nr:hypothetical protein FRC09_015359 [Ceratobasidium sp. 395]
MVKAFIEHFVRPAPKKRKAVKYKKSNKRRRVELPVSRDDNLESTSSELVEYVIDEGGADESSDLEDDSVATMVEKGLDEDKVLHDQYVIKETTEEAIQYAQRTLKLKITNAMQAAARGVLSKAAKKLCKSPTLQAKFEVLIDGAREQLNTLRRALARRVPTRWNSDYECLLSLSDLRPCVEMLTADSANGLQHLTLDETQWHILEQLLRVLRVRLI